MRINERLIQTWTCERDVARTARGRSALTGEWAQVELGRAHG